MKKSNLMPSIVLGCICLVAALLLSVVNKFTAPLIAKHQSEAASGAFAEILPGATGQQELVIDGSYPSVVTAGYKFDNGYVFQMEVTGYQPGLIILCGIDLDGKITGVKHIQTKETYGVESELNGAYVGDTLDSIEKVLTASPTAPLTSGAYYEAVKAALQAYAIAKGETVDTRSEEEKFLDNCNAALGTNGKTFTRFFESWSGFGDAEVYTCDAGTVIVVGESFVGYLTGSTTPVGTPDASALTAAQSAYNAYASLEKVTIPTISGISGVKAVYKNSSGEYMFSLSKKGFSYAASPMIIEVIINADGVITSCVTVSHSESGGYGSICGTPEYYEQYVGKTIDTYNTVPNIIAPALGENAGLNGGATQTSNGYKKAIGEAFRAFNALTEEGGND